MGIIGANGAGKTTLFKILTRELTYESGNVYITPDKRVGILEQLPVYELHLTVREVLWQAFEHLEQMSKKIKEYEKLMETSTDKTVLAEYSALLQGFEFSGGYEMDVQYAKMTNGLNIPKEMQERPFMSLSGGEKTRVNLAKTMLLGTEILLLDEPTNHLDIASVEWFEDYLANFRGAAVIISHDRYFLDKTTNVTMEIENGVLRSHPAPYTEYMDKKQQEIELQEAAKARQDKEIARLEFTIDRMKGWGLGNKKVMKRAFSMEKRLNRIERIDSVKKAHKIKGKFSGATRTGDEVFYIDNLSIGYDAPLISDFTALVLRGERVAILGDNGCGKTTLLNTLQDVHKPLLGKIIDGAGLKIGILPQEIVFANAERTVLDTMLYETTMSVGESRNRLGAYGFRGDDVFKTVDVLSGGEKTRLKLCIFMHEEINTLFLDEPTNHLDILAREWLEDALYDYSETMLFVSHDRYFIDKFATRIWMVENGRVTDFLGGYDEYLAHNKRMAEVAQAQNRAQSSKKPKKEQKSNEYNDKRVKKQLGIQAQELEREISEIELRIEENAADYEMLGGLMEKRELLENELLVIYSQLDTFG